MPRPPHRSSTGRQQRRTSRRLFIEQLEPRMQPAVLLPGLVVPDPLVVGEVGPVVREPVVPTFVLLPVELPTYSRPIQFIPEPVTLEPVTPEPVTLEPVIQEPIAPVPIAPVLVNPEPTNPEPVISEPPAPAPDLIAPSEPPASLFPPFFDKTPRTATDPSLHPVGTQHAVSGQTLIVPLVADNPTGEPIFFNVFKPADESLSFGYGLVFQGFQVDVPSGFTGTIHMLVGIARGEGIDYWKPLIDWEMVEIEVTPPHLPADGIEPELIEALPVNIQAGPMAEISLAATNAPDDPVFFYAYPAPHQSVDLKINVWPRSGIVHVFPPSDFRGSVQVLVGIRRSEHAAETDPFVASKLITINFAAPQPPPLPPPPPAAPPPPGEWQPPWFDPASVEYSLQATNLDGSPVTSLVPGQEFYLRAFVRDLRQTPQGVFAAYIDIQWDASLAKAVGDIERTQTYANGDRCDASTPGVLHAAGGFSGVNRLGGGRLEFFRIRIQATGVGDLRFDAEPVVTDAPLYDTLAYGDPDAIPLDRMTVNDLGVTIAEPSLPTPPPVSDPPASNPPSPTPFPPLNSPASTIAEPLLDPQSQGHDVVYALVATTPDGQRLTDVQPGQEFVLHLFVLDQRDVPRGVFAAYVNLHWDSRLAEATGQVQQSPGFGNGTSGDASVPGLLSEAGGFSGLREAGAGFHQVFSVPMRALASGNLHFEASPALILPNHDTLLYRDTFHVESDRISYQDLSLTIATAAPPEIATPLPPPPTLPPSPTLPPPLITENPAPTPDPTPAATPAPTPALSAASTPSDILAVLACDLASAVLGKRPRA